MKITGPGQITPKSIKKNNAGKTSGASGFADALGDSQASGSVSNVGGASPLATVNALLSLQEAPDATEGRSKGLARANEMLELLEDVRKGLLLGAIPKANLETLAALARNQKGRSNDQNLDDILSDIELRAEVELAKLGY